MTSIKLPTHPVLHQKPRLPLNPLHQSFPSLPPPSPSLLLKELLAPPPVSSPIPSSKLLFLLLPLLRQPLQHFLLLRERKISTLRPPVLLSLLFALRIPFLRVLDRLAGATVLRVGFAYLEAADGAFFISAVAEGVGWVVVDPG
jgi:hypothetical protein